MCPRTEEEKIPMANVPFLEGVGSLMHLANLTRPDISFAVGQASSYSIKPWYGTLEGTEENPGLPAQDN